MSEGGVDPAEHDHAHHGLLGVELARAEREKEMNALKGDGGNSWGAQMRSYVMNPYQMVKDLRTEHEVGNPDAVFDGDIDGFIDAGIRWRKRTETSAR